MNDKDTTQTESEPNLYGTTYGLTKIIDPIHRISKREYFAAVALQGIVASNYSNNASQSFITMARHAVQIAEYLIDALNEE